MIDTKQPQNHFDVTSCMITMKYLFSTVLKEHVVVASSESTFLETEVGFDLSVLTIRVKLIPQSIGFAFFKNSWQKPLLFGIKRMRSD